MGACNKKSLLNINRQAEKYTQQYCATIFWKHAFTKCDSTHVPYVRIQLPTAWIRGVTWNSHDCAIQLILHSRPQKASTMPKMCWATHQCVIDLHIVAIWKQDHIAEPDIQASFNGNRWENKDRIRPWSHCRLRGIFCQESWWPCGWGWIRCQFWRGKGYACWFAFCVSDYALYIIISKVAGINIFISKQLVNLAIC